MSGQNTPNGTTSVKATAPKNNAQASVDTPKELKIISGYWKNLKKEKIIKARFEDTVCFEVEVHGATKVFLQMYADDSIISDKKIGDTVEVLVKNNVAKHNVELNDEILRKVTDGLYLEVKAVNDKKSTVKDLPLNKEDYLRTVVIGGALLIVFPDFPIDPEINVKGWKAPKLDFLGHAGVLIIKNNGASIYYEYGRYPTGDNTKGKVRKYELANKISFDEDGIPTEKSLKPVLKRITNASGKKGQVWGAYVISNKTNEMIKYANEKYNESNKGCKGYNVNRKEYTITGNNCGTFASDVVCQDNMVDKPFITNPTPRNIVGEYWEEKNTEIKYNPNDESFSIKKGDESDAKK